MERNTENYSRIDRLREEQTLPREEMGALLSSMTKEEASYLYLPKRRFWTAATRDICWDFAPLSFRGARISILQMKKSVRLSERSDKSIRTAP